MGLSFLTCNIIELDSLISRIILSLLLQINTINMTCYFFLTGKPFRPREQPGPPGFISQTLTNFIALRSSLTPASRQNHCQFQIRDYFVNIFIEHAASQYTVHRMLQLWNGIPDFPRSLSLLWGRVFLVLILLIPVCLTQYLIISRVFLDYVEPIGK